MNKIEKLQNFLSPHEAALIFSDPVRYYFNGYLADSGVLVVTKNKSLFYTDFRYIEEAKAKIKDCEALKSNNFYFHSCRHKYIHPFRMEHILDMSFEKLQLYMPL